MNQSTMEPKTKPIADLVLDAMHRDWLNHGWIDEPYSEREALEIALNELIDKATALDLTVRVVEGAYADVRGVKCGEV